MSKYNANGGQRRSSTTKLYVGEQTIACRICKAVESRLSAKLKNWEMQHMHLASGELEFMTCPKCKTMNPIKMLEMIGVEIE